MNPSPDLPPSHRPDCIHIKGSVTTRLDEVGDYPADVCTRAKLFQIKYLPETSMKKSRQKNKYIQYKKFLRGDLWICRPLVFSKTWSENSYPPFNFREESLPHVANCHGNSQKAVPRRHRASIFKIPNQLPLQRSRQDVIPAK